MFTFYHTSTKNPLLAENHSLIKFRFSFFFWISWRFSIAPELLQNFLLLLNIMQLCQLLLCNNFLDSTYLNLSTVYCSVLFRFLHNLMDVSRILYCHWIWVPDSSWTCEAESLTDPEHKKQSSWQLLNIWSRVPDSSWTYEAESLTAPEHMKPSPWHLLNIWSRVPDRSCT